MLLVDRNWMMLFQIISSRNAEFVQNHLWYLKENSAAGCKLLLMVHLPRKHGKRMDIGKYSVFKLCVCQLYGLSLLSIPVMKSFVRQKVFRQQWSWKFCQASWYSWKIRAHFWLHKALFGQEWLFRQWLCPRSRYWCVCSSARWTPDREWCNLWLGSNYSALQEEFREWLVQRACRVLLSCRIIMIIKEEWLSTSYLFTLR